MKKWASSPWATNLAHVPGLGALKSYPGVSAQKCLMTLCPEAISPSNNVAEETSEGFILIRRNGLCGKMNTDEINARTPGISCDKGHLRFLYTTSYGASVHYLWKSDLEVDRKVMPTGAGVGAAG